MRKTPDLCRSSDELLALLQDQLTPEAEADWQVHLHGCTSCRRQLERLAAEPAVWNEASQFLSDLSANEVSLTRAENDPDFAERLPIQVRQVLETLGATDDPAKLGRIGGYEVSGVVGAGGMGVVLKAHDRALDRVVAIKVLAPHLASSSSARKRFAREAKAAAAVIHPNVIAIYGVSNEEALPYLVMPFVGGSSLQRRLNNQGALPVAEVLRIGHQIAAGLAAAHAQGLVHRDIKPANIMLDDGVERVSITDFGLARAVDDASMTRTGVIAGTPQFMSPEQARGEAIEHRSDLFSLGSVLYAMCTGRAPFHAETSYGVLRRITDDHPTPIRENNPDTPPWLCQVVNTLMAKKPEDRFESAEMAAELLEDCLAHVQQPLTTPLPTSLRVAENSGRFPRVLKKWVAAAFAFLLIFVGALIVVEMNKGKLTIECSADDVPIRVLQGDTVVKKMSVTKSGATIRIAAGTYVVEVDGEFDDLLVKDGSVVLSRGGHEMVRIEKSDSDQRAQEDIAAARQVADKFITAKLRGRKAEMEACLSASHDPRIDEELMDGFMQIVFSKDPQFVEAYVHHQDPDDMLLVTPVLDPDKQLAGPARMFFGMKREEGGWRICEVMVFSLEDIDQIISFYKKGTRLPYLLRPERDLKPPIPDAPVSARQTGEIQLAKADALVSAHGKVVDSDGNPLAGVKVHLCDSPVYRTMELSRLHPEVGHRGTGQLDLTIATTLTDAAGNFRFEGVRAPHYQKFKKHPGSWVVMIPASEKTAVVGKKLAGPEHTAPIRFTLERSQSAIGQVVDSSGDPVVGIKVYAIGIADLDEKVRGERSLALWDSDLSPKTTTDSDGRFVLHGLPPDKRILIGTNPHAEYCPTGGYFATTDQAQPDLKDRRISSDGSSTSYGKVWTGEIKLEVEKGHRISGQVVFPDRSPAKDLRGRVYRKSTNVPISFSLDDEGKFETQSLFLDSTARVCIYPPRDSKWIASLDVVNFETEGEHKNIHVMLQEGAIVTGSLLTKEGDPIAGAHMLMLPDEQRLLPSYVVSWSAKTDEAGTFSLRAKPNIKGTLFATKKKGTLVGYDLPNSSRVFGAGYTPDDARVLPLRRRDVKFQPSIRINTGEIGELPTPVQLVLGQDDQMSTSGVDASDATTAPLLTTVEQVESHLREWFLVRQRLDNADVEFRLVGSGGYDYNREYHVWLNGEKRRSDVNGVANDGRSDQTQVLTPDYSYFIDRVSGGPQYSARDSKGTNKPVGWHGVAGIPDLRKFGLVAWNVESLNSHKFGKNLLNDARQDVRVEIGRHEGQPITIVKSVNKYDDEHGKSEGWTEYWLSPTYGNLPIYLATGSTLPDAEERVVTQTQRVQWKRFDAVWFPQSIEYTYQMTGKPDSRFNLTVTSARFGLNPFPDVFDPDAIPSPDSKTGD